MNKRLLTVTVSLIAFVFFSLISYAQNQDESLSKKDDLLALTVKIASLSTKLPKEQFSENNQIENSIAQLAEKRYAQLTGLIETDAAEVLRVALPAEVLSKIPSNLENYFEKREETEGELEVIAACEENDGRILYYLNNGKERLSLYFAKQPSVELLTGARIHIKSIRVGDAVAVNNQENASTDFQMLEAPLPNTLGEQRVLVLLVNFQDDQRTPYTIDQANNMVFGTVNNYYREVSFGQTSLSGDARGWFTLPINASSGYCLNSSGDQIATYAKQAATNAGINLSAYNKFMYVFPQLSSCAYAGWAFVGGTDVWINNYLIFRTTAHELGHTFGLYHAKSLSCDSGVLSGTCSSAEYGHITDMMGSPGVTGHFHAFQKEQLGWLNNGSMPPITTVTQNGNYFIAPSATTGTDAKALKILKSVDSSGKQTWYYIEVRRPFGYDSFVSSNSSVMNGVLITMNQELSPYENFLLDMTPETTSLTDSALAVNRSYNDTTAAITITPLSVSNTGSIVNVSFGNASCSQANPTIAVSPSATQWIGAGGSLSYSVTVTNNNSNICANNNFNVQPTLPVGWSAVVATPTLNIASGASATTTVQVTSPTSAIDGFYSIAVRASNSNSPSYSASASVSVAVYSSLGVTASPSQTSYTRTQTATVTAYISANGSPIAGANVTFTMTKSNGNRVIVNAISAADGSAVFTYRFNKRQDPTGTYSVNAVTSLNGVSGNGSTSFEVR